MGVTTFVEIGPGTVLTGLIKRIVPDAATLNVNDPKSLEATHGARLEVVVRTKERRHVIAGKSGDCHRCGTGHRPCDRGNLG